jgi:carbonic anhydrase
MLEWRHVTDGPDLERVRKLFKEYADWLGIDLCFQGFEQELKTLPGAYAPPSGALFLVMDGEEAVACVALKKFSNGIAEMKRLYVKPRLRNHGLGKSLSMRAIDVAEALGYDYIRLDTLRRMEEAIQLYSYLGFDEIEPYYNNPEADAVFMEKKL